jgi:hypothetical protein
MLNQAAILKRVFTVLIALWLWQWGHCMTEISSLPSFYMPRIKDQCHKDTTPEPLSSLIKEKNSEAIVAANSRT